MRTLLLIVAATLAAVAEAISKDQPGPKLIDETTRWSECKAGSNQSIYDFQVETLEGDFTDLSQYRGQVLLVINVATFCGLLAFFGYIFVFLLVTSDNWIRVCFEKFCALCTFPPGKRESDCFYLTRFSSDFSVINVSPIYWIDGH